MYNKLQKTAGSIIERFGVKANISSRTGFVVKDQLNYKYQMANGAIIQSGDLMLICSASLDPKLNNDITIGEEIYKVINVMPVNPATINVIVEVHARKMS